MEQNYYVNQLTTTDFMELFSRIQLLVEQKGRIIRVEYDFKTPAKRIKLEGTKPFCTIFLKDFTCTVSNCHSEQIQNEIKKIYRNFMLEKFIGTSYDDEASAFDAAQEEKKLKQANKPTI